MRGLSRTETRWRFSGLCLVALLAAARGCASPADEPPPAPATGAAALDVAPAVAKLLELKAEAKAVPDFVNRLEALAKDQGWQPQLAECKKLSFSGWDEARAVPVRSGQNQYVVVLLKGWTHTIPGSDAQTVILLDTQGKYLDHLGCEINARLTRMHFGQLHTVIPAEPEAGGAHLVIRLDGLSARGNFSHHVRRGGEEAEFSWGHGHLPPSQPTKWDTNGLCRIAIRGGQFQVLFPGEQDKGNEGRPKR